jgi:hypothetical protein
VYQMDLRIVCIFNARRRLRKTCEATWGIRRPYNVMVFIGSMVGRTMGTPIWSRSNGCVGVSDVVQS